MTTRYDALREKLYWLELMNREKASGYQKACEGRFSEYAYIYSEFARALRDLSDLLDVSQREEKEGDQARMDTQKVTSDDSRTASASEPISPLTQAGCPCIPVCGLASSTHVDSLDGNERCDLCGHIAERCESDELSALRMLSDELLAALKAVAQTDDDCPVCDRGRLRNPEKTHWPECPFGLAHALIAKVEGL